MQTLKSISKKHTLRLKDIQIDKGLDQLCSQTKKGETLTCNQIAEACGCSKSTIQKITETALKKLAINPLMQQHHADTL